MASRIQVYMAGNNKEHALGSFIWDEPEEAAEYARENNYQYVYSVSQIVEEDDLDLVMDLDAEPEGI